MECFFEFDRENRILRVRIDGTITDSGLKECYETTRVYVTKTTPRAALLDIVSVESQLSSGALRQIADSPPILRDPAPRVIVARSIYLFGMARMFQILGGKTREQLYVVRTLEEAYAILGVTSPSFDPVELDSLENSA